MHSFEQIVQRLEAHRKTRGDKHISLNDEQVQQMALPEDVRYIALKDLLEKTVSCCFEVFNIT